ncbi:MAG: dGTPase [Solirubrobacterales bacterium]|jgi:dGTPase|nr:dGTPase [Solirubrobacterales bacterium]
MSDQRAGEPDWTQRAAADGGRRGGGSPFEIDRDRIVHCDTFRDLQHKTQVQTVVRDAEKVRYRTRLNHVLEVAQIARGLAGELEADPNLAEAISLAHDLGHPPFGHAGERALAAALQRLGHEGWNANAHSLLVVDRIECMFIDFRGLNLTLGTREGIARHSTPFDDPKPWPEAGDLPHSGLEAQIADAADVLAYLSHDLDDALTAGYLTLDDVRATSPEIADLAEAPAESWDASPWPSREHPQLARRRLVARLIGRCIGDLAASSRARIEEYAGGDHGAVRSVAMRTVVYSDKFDSRMRALLDLLRDSYYHSASVRSSDREAEEIVVGLFDALLNDLATVPERFLVSGEAVELGVASYVASLTDVSATALAERLGIR